MGDVMEGICCRPPDREKEVDEVCFIELENVSQLQPQYSVIRLWSLPSQSHFRSHERLEATGNSKHDFAGASNA